MHIYVITSLLTNMTTIKECLEEEEEDNYDEDGNVVYLDLSTVIVDEDHPFDLNEIPDTVTQLYFPHNWEKYIVGSSLPSSLKYIHFGEWFDVELEPEFLPYGLEKIYFGQSYNQPIKYGVCPNTVKKIKIGEQWKLGFEGWFNVPKDQIILPNSVEKVTIMLGHCDRVPECPFTAPQVGCRHVYIKGTEEFNNRFTVIETMANSATE